MEEVLNSVKRKHKQKHKRLKEQKKKAQMEAIAAAAETQEIIMKNGEDKDGVTEGAPKVTSEEHSEIKHKKKDKHQRRHHKSSLKEKVVATENGLSNTKSKHKSSPTKLKKSPLKAVTKANGSESILKHFHKTPKKNDEDSGGDSAKRVNNLTKTNAFEVMMNARNKAIGSNTPGKDPSQVKSPGSEEVSSTTCNVKRKLMLQEWAEKKGAAKRKLEEESREAFIEHQLEQRAKKFKQMLVNGASPKSSPSNGKLPKVSESKAKNLKNDVTNEGPRKRGRKKKRRSPSVESVESREENPVDAETAEFLSKLSSPTKKRDSLLAYFPKKESPNQLAAKVLNDSPKQPAETKTKETKKVNLTLSTTSRVVQKVAQEIDDESDTPKRRSRRAHLGNTNSDSLTSDMLSTPKLDSENQSTPSSTVGRPKRSCVGKVRYDHDSDQELLSEEIDTKKKSSSQGRSSVKEPKSSKASEPEVEVIVVDDNSLIETPTKTEKIQQTPKKLAPLFLKAVPKPSPDPLILKARQDFLRSGVPEKLRLEQIKQKQFEQSYEDALELFPKIAHILQYNEDEQVSYSKVIDRPLSFNLLSLEENTKKEKSTPQPRSNKRKSKSKSYTFGILTNCTNQDYKTCLQGKLRSCSLEFLQLSSLENKRNIIKTWKNNFERFPTYKCYNQMREKYRYFSAVDSEQDTEQFSESLVVTRRTRRSLEAQKKLNSEGSEDEAKPPPAAPNGELLFTEKYKPLMFEQVLVNLTPVTQLKEFLSNWAFGNNPTPRNSQTMDDSTDFIANDSNSSHTNACNSVVLLGPASSGKTNAVFALANEMNFNVLEINAGMKRTGKKLIQELQEATQSHQIRKDSKGQKQLLKMSLNGLKTKKSTSSPSTTSGTTNALLNNNSQSLDNDTANDQAQNARKCLILIEDADIVFEQTDAGFVDALYTLAASSKRPVIAVASNPNCNHLQRLMQQNTIVFNAPNVLNISKYLAVLSLIENCPIVLDDLISLHLYNKKDLRRTMLQLQFFIQSGGDREKQLLAKNETKPKKQGQDTNASEATGGVSKTEDQRYFASPTKRRLSEDCSSNLNPDETLEKAKHRENLYNKLEKNQEVYMHRCLFEFYTTNQNEKWRIPFPVDFDLLRTNLNEIFQHSRLLKASVKVETTPSPSTTVSKAKRTSRSPKKEWLNTATTAANALEEAKKTSLKALCSFYDNISVATMINTSHDHNDDKKDRLVSHLSEDISHALVEKAIATNLEADNCSYNLFDTRQSSISLSDDLGNMVLRTKRSRYLDFEPCMRGICRSEKLRSKLERRSTRFYHYLRNVCVNTTSFYNEQFDEACDILQTSTEPSESSDNPAESIVVPKRSLHY